MFKKSKKSGDESVKPADAAASIEASDVTAEGAVAVKPKKHKKKRIIIAIVVVILVVFLGVVGWMLYIGALAPGFAAAKYDGMHYITEKQVTDYIDSYKKQQGYEDCTDEQWAVYLAYYGLTPETLRESTIQQLVTTELIEKEAKKNGVEITDEEWEEYATNIKNNLAFGDEEVYEETIEAQGQTVEEFEDSYRNMLLRQRLYEEVVEMPEATEEETMEYLEENYPDGTTTKHIYYFHYEVEDMGDEDSDDDSEEESHLEDIQYVQTALNELVDMGLSTENFETIVSEYCNDEDLISRSGANGWDLDMDDYGDEYQEAVEETERGGVSDVFEEDDGYGFVYIDTTYDLPASDEDYSLDDMPDTLAEYFSDCEAYELWTDDCNEYLAQLYEDSGCIMYAMPENATYNVDMDLATEYAEEEMEEEDSDEDSDSSDDGEDGSDDGDSSGESDAEDEAAEDSTDEDAGSEE